MTKESIDKLHSLINHLLQNKWNISESGKDSFTIELQGTKETIEFRLKMNSYSAQMDDLDIVTNNRIITSENITTMAVFYTELGNICHNPDLLAEIKNILKS